MGRATQIWDYYHRKPRDFYPEIQSQDYTHFKITGEDKRRRRELKLYKEDQIQLDLFNSQM